MAYEPRKAQEQERLNGAREALARAQAELKNAQLRVNEAELEVKARRDKIQALKQNQVLLKTNKEFQMYNLEIAKLEKYVKDARKLKEQLEQLRKWLPQGKDEAPVDTTQPPDSYLEYLQAKAATTPTVTMLAKRILADKVALPSELFGNSAVLLTNLSDAPEVLGEPIRVLRRRQRVGRLEVARGPGARRRACRRGGPQGHHRLAELLEHGLAEIPRVRQYRIWDGDGSDRLARLAGLVGDLRIAAARSVLEDLVRHRRAHLGTRRSELTFGSDLGSRERQGTHRGQPREQHHRDGDHDGDQHRPALVAAHVAASHPQGDSPAAAPVREPRLAVSRTAAGCRHGVLAGRLAGLLGVTSATTVCRRCRVGDHRIPRSGRQRAGSSSCSTRSEPVASTMTPSRRKTTRSAQPA